MQRSLGFHSHSAAPAAASTSLRTQFPPTAALLFPSLLERQASPQQDPGMPRIPERLWLLPRRRRAPPAPHSLPWLLCSVCTGRVALLQVMRLCRSCRGELFDCASSVGAVVKQLKKGKKEQRGQRKGGGGREGEPLQKSEARGSGAGRLAAVHEYRAARMEVGISAGCTEKPLTPFGRFTLIAFFPFLFVVRIL